LCLCPNHPRYYGMMHLSRRRCCCFCCYCCSCCCLARSEGLLIGASYAHEGKGRIGEQRECGDMRVAQVRSSGYKGRRKVSVQDLAEIATQVQAQQWRGGEIQARRRSLARLRRWLRRERWWSWSNNLLRVFIHHKPARACRLGPAACCRGRCAGARRHTQRYTRRYARSSRLTNAILCCPAGICAWR